MKRTKSMRCVIATLAVTLLSITMAHASLAESSPTKQRVRSKKTSIYFAVNESSRIDSLNYLELSNLIFQAQRYDDSPIIITGWADGTGNEQYNKQLSAARAATAKRYLEKEGIDASRITYSGMGIDKSISNRAARRATITIEIAAVPERQTGGPKTPATIKREPKITNQEAATPLSEPTTVTTLKAPEVTTERGKFAIRTNLLYWLGASINAGFEWNPAGTSLGVILNGGYAPLGHDDWKHSLGGWFVSPELRLYLGRTKQWFVGAELLVGGYNYKLSDIGYQGRTLAGGITGGYKIELSKTFDMDFSLGLGYGTLEYDTYFHEDGTNYRINNNVKKNTLMPIQAGVSLIWKIR